MTSSRRFLRLSPVLKAPSYMARKQVSLPMVAFPHDHKDPITLNYASLRTYLYTQHSTHPSDPSQISTIISLFQHHCNTTIHRKLYKAAYGGVLERPE